MASLPDRFDAALECFLFVSPEPVTPAQVAGALEIDERAAREALEGLRERFASPGLQVVRVAGGYLHFDPLSGKLGLLPLPQSALDNAVRRMLESPENKEKFRLPPGINDIRIEGGELFVVYR